MRGLVGMFPDGGAANAKPTIQNHLNGFAHGSSACSQHCSNGIAMCVPNQWAFLRVEILNGFKWSISRRVRC